MALSDSMFLVEIIVEELKSMVKCKNFVIKSEFANMFSMTMTDPRELLIVTSKPVAKKKSKRKKGKKHPRFLLRQSPTGFNVQAGQAILLVSDIDTLIINMQKYPIEFSLWNKDYPDYKIASTNIPWNASYINYLNKLDTRKEFESITTTGEYNVFDEYTSKRMAIVKLSIKLCYLKDRLPTPLRCLSKENSQAFMCPDVDSKPSLALKNREKAIKYAQGTGVIKTIYSGGARKFKKSRRNKNKPATQLDIPKGKQTYDDKKPPANNVDKSHKMETKKRINESIISLVKSDVDIDKQKQIDLIKTKSCSSMSRDHLNILNYIFGDKTGPFGNQVYCVSYFTVENDADGSSKSPNSPKKSIQERGSSEKTGVSGKSSDGEKFQLRLCDRACENKPGGRDACGFSICSLDLQGEQSNVSIQKCKAVDCHHKTYRKVRTPPDERILLDLTSLKRDCCDKRPVKEDKIEKIEKVEGGMKANIKLGEDPCFCECECRFGFTKKTTYCKICGGYEKEGEELAEFRHPDKPFPCPVYHNLLDKVKPKPSVTGSDSKRPAKAKSVEKNIESERDLKKSKKKKKDDKFKFNYGYTAPQIGHSDCAHPCTGTLGAVPKNMGWLWTAEDIPGMKFRPLWKPGAVNKYVLRLLRMAGNPGEVLAKKQRKKDMAKNKRPLRRPLLIVAKKDGEYTVTMETMKAYSKPRAINQLPYEDKPAVTYTIGRTEEENRERRKKKERAQRRLERSQREFIQSAFRDMCEEICLKTYQQALGILPDTEKPDCTCYPAQPGPDRTDLDHSCSCSEDTNLSSLDTDNDDWVVEFTPPTATFDPTFKSKKVQLTDNSSQYTYLDYRVKLLDRYGNPVPRFFRGPDGREQCSDLGGFWGPGKNWLEINVDGYIGQDGRWAPNTFIGPNGEHVEADSGKFQTADGTWLVVGIDGFVDCNGRWRFYGKGKVQTPIKKRIAPPRIGPVDKKAKPGGPKKSQATWSCFGDATPKQLSEIGITGHGHDRRLLLDTLKRLIAQGEDVKIPQPSTVPRSRRRRGKGKRVDVVYTAQSHYADRMKCSHSIPSDKGILAVDGEGNKTYFRLKNFGNKRPKQRIATLTDQGISLSSFHVPCFHSFISREIMKKQLYRRLAALAKKRR